MFNDNDDQRANRKPLMFYVLIAMTVILVLTLAFAAVAAVTLRNQQINGKLETLTRQAREIAYLASQNEASSMALYFGFEDDIQKYIDWKARTVWDEYGAYILVVDRMGRVMDNLSQAMNEDPDFAASLNGEELSEAMTRVLGGEEVSVRVLVNGSPTFTVGVPFVRGDKVLGAVLIRTRAQVVEGDISSLILPLIILVLLLTLFAGVAIFFAMRSLMRPMQNLTRAARAISDGDFTVRVPTEKQTREITELSRAFNTMTEQIQGNDENRREFVANVSHEL